MLNISLTAKQKLTLELRHKKSRDKRECNRIKAILLPDEGWSVEMIAQALRIHETSISRHINEFIKTEKFIPQSGGSDGYLNEIKLVLDGAGYHRSADVKTTAKELGIILHYLPPYSPNLNPIERRWKVMNKQVRNNKYFATAKEFREGISAFFTATLPDIADSLGRTINDNFQRF